METDPNIQPGQLYKVRLRRVIKLGRIYLRPGEDVTLKGAILQAHLDSVLDYQPA